MVFSRLYMLAAMEWMKLSTRLNIVFTIIIFALIALQVGFVVRVELAGVGMGTGAHAGYIYNNAYKYIDNIAFTFIPVLYLLNVSKEFEYAVVQRSLVSGLSRNAYYFSKLIHLIFFSIVALISAILFSMLTAAVYDLPVQLNYGKVFIYCPVSFCLSSLSLFLVTMLRKSIHSLAAFIGYIFIENTLNGLLIQREIYLLLPFQACMELLRHNIHDYSHFVMMAIYTVLFVLLGYRRFIKMDLQ